MSDDLRFFYKRGKEKLEMILHDIQDDYKEKRNPIEHQKTRFKSDMSIYGKLRKKHTDEMQISNIDSEIKNTINDVIGARIVCPFLSDIEEIKEKIKNHPDLKFIDEKDYIKYPKDSGYRSYHVRVWVKIVIDNEEKWVKAEIQIRTILMDMWASLEHKIHYKKRVTLSEETQKQMLEIADICEILDEELDKKKTEEEKEENIFQDLLSEEEYSRITKKFKYAQKIALDKIKDLYTTFQYKEIDMQNKNIYESDIQNVNPIEHIETRIKPANSLIKKLYSKMQEGTIKNAEDAISDIAGVRIVCSFESDVFTIANIIKNKLGFEVEEIKDYVNNPKENGYSGYHIIVKIPYYHENGSMEKVKVEIQIRTIAMDMWAIVERNLRSKELTNAERQHQLNQLARLRKKIDNSMNEIIENFTETQSKEKVETKTKIRIKEKSTS